ncbi:phosphomannomutase/phosphoglucomutase [Nocardioides marmorisolisilvae]|uniref:Phosphomannomutase/phosphoglucomutase n=1 Tax=Nocardioides marmorisolisilvae TaxID=1542737 RepID=A0A3N0DSL7_9ACTN|nr:phosphomannomutase/phosphoglucomutase [Nocardioides marmorisolisilvae]RNL78637.1 phosphomannomutase/phosphoglucomutase [Nocardioides marmorisolisilvae]
MSTDLNAFFKAYDVRGTVPDQINAELVRKVGNAFVAVIGDGPIVVGYDMRPSSPELARAFADGAREAGADVTLIGLCSTDGLYFASGHLGRAGAMFTASHNPAQYNGIKMCRTHAQPIGMETGLAEIRDRVASGETLTADTPGSLDEVELLEEYAAYLLKLAPVSGRRLKIAVDAGNGMGGLTTPAVLSRIDAEVFPLYFELDGTFPNHEANPIEPENLVDLQAAVLEHGADIGLAFDGDADRCFLVDERGELVSPSVLTALIAARELAKEPGAPIIHNLITSRAVPEIVTELGGRPVRTRVGHSFIKATMATENAIFGGEHSGHFYFRDFWRADSGMLAALHALAALAETDAPLSAVLAPYTRHVASGEINTSVADQQAILDQLEADWGTRPGVSVDHLDGLSVVAADWWFNVRASNTEPLLRLNAEGKDEATMQQIRDEVLAAIRA